MRLPSSKPKRARIEIVPMIDTVFFLLVYFLMASLAMTHLNARKVSMPFSSTATGKPATDVVITVAKDGRDYLDRTAVAESEIAPALNERLKAEPNLTVIINCDKDQPAGRLALVFDLVKQSNASSVMVATTPKESWAGQQ
jgi:biopolymer transport protein ExbD